MNVAAVALLDDVRMALADDSVQIVDARSAERFAGKAPEPRPGLRSGHMPRSFNVPYERLLENGRLASRERVAAAFTAAGVDLDKPDHHHLRLRRHRRDPDLRAAIARQGTEGPLRRLLGGMGLAPRSAGRAR